MESTERITNILDHPWSELPTATGEERLAFLSDEGGNENQAYDAARFSYSAAFCYTEAFCGHGTRTAAI